MDYIEFVSGQTENNFWFKGKRELIKILMKKVDGSNISILNVGVGTGDELNILNKYGQIYVIDINPKVLELIPEGLYKEKKICDITNITYPDNKFDMVVSFDVFEHIKNDFDAVSEIYRVLKTGGYLVFTVPAFQFIFSAHDRAVSHYRRYNKKSLQKLLKNFKKLKMNYWNTSIFFPISILRILKKKSTPKLDYFNLPEGLNNLLYKILLFENRIIESKFKLPIGLSIVGYCIKP